MLESTSRLLVVHPDRSLVELAVDDAHYRVAVDVDQFSFDRSIIDQIDDRYDLFVLDWSLERPDARGVLDAVQQHAPNSWVLAIADEVPADDPVDRGADALLVAPVSDDELRSTIDRLLLQRAYEATMDELFRLSTERALLETEQESGIEVGDRYEAITADLQTYRDRAARIRDALSSEEFDQTLRRLFGE